MIAFKPEQRIAQQEIIHFFSAVIEDERAPVAMLALAGVFMLIEAGPIKVDQPVRVAGEVRGNPVKDHADPVLVQVIHEVHEVGGRSIPAGWREVADGLIPPRAIKRMFRNRKQLDMGIPHPGCIIGKPMRQLPVCQEIILRFMRPHPGAQMYFVDGHGSLKRVLLSARFDPQRVSPLIRIDVEHARGGPGWRLEGEGERVALRARGSPDCDLISNLYSAPSVSPGIKRSQMPFPGWFRIG